MRFLILVILLFAAPAFAQTATPTPTNTPTATFAPPATPVCSGAKLTGSLRHVSQTIANTTEVALIEASASDKSIVLHSLCASAAGATVVTVTVEQPYEAVTRKLDFVGAGSACLDVSGFCLPDGKDLTVKQSASVSTQVSASYTEQ